MNIIRKLNNMIAIKESLTAKGEVDGWTENERKIFLGISEIESRIDLWKKEGSITFVLDKNLIEAFQNTDIPMDLTPNDFQYPFDCFLIESRDIPFFITSMPYGSAPVYVVLCTSDTTVFKYYKTFMDFDGIRRSSLEWNKSLNGFFPAASSEYMETISLNMKGTVSIEDTAKLHNSLGDLPIERSDAQGLVNIFYNTILYINDPTRIKEETESTNTRNVKSGDGKTHHSQKYITLKAPKNYRSLSEMTGRTIDVRFVVRGHWTNQAFGEKHSLRRRQWIMPYWKGPEMSEVLTKPYLVK